MRQLYRMFQNPELIRPELSWTYYRSLMPVKSNPFLSADDIHSILAQQIEADLDNDMDE